MLKDSIGACAMVLVLALSLGLPADANQKSKKTKAQQQKQQQQQQQQQQNDQDALQAPQQGQYDRGGDSSSGNSGGDSVSMFKAGNTSLPAGTYAMTNVSTGSAFVVIVDDSGDMRAQDARAMNLVDEKNPPKRSSQANSGRNNSGSSARDSEYGSSQYSGSGNYQSGNSQSGGTPARLTPEPIPSSAVLPTPTSSGSHHPLLQGSNQSNIFQSSQPGGSLPSLFTQTNPLLQGLQGQATTGQIPGGMKGKIQAEIERQLGKQLMKHAPAIERQVQKVIQKMN